MIPTRMPDTSAPLTLEFFVNPRCPPGSSFVLSIDEPVKTAGEDFPTKELSAADGGVDILSGPPARLDKATEG